MICSDSSTRMGMLALLFLVVASSAGAADFMFQAVIGGKTIEGSPLTWSDATMVLLGRDGRLHEFAPSQARKAKRTAPRFSGYSTSEMRQQLYQEFDNRFEFTSTGHYLVAHPRTERGVWADRFEELYRSFVNYFRVRGFSPVEPPYPLVAVVFSNRSEYNRYVKKNSPGAPTGALGHYEPRSNRVYLYDQSSVGDERWSETAATVIHEATHQTAYNVGVHSRFASTPRWVSEGLATMFEARGVHSTRSYDRKSERVNRMRLADYRELVEPNQPMGPIARFIASDDPFVRTVIPAYAEAWALTFFLCETRPREYSAYLARLADRPIFTEYSPAERVADFQTAFGEDLRQLDTQFANFIASLR